MLAVSDGLHKSMAVPFYVIINSVNDEIPDLRLRNITIMEGDFCVIGRGILSTEDLDVPQDMLSFSIASPPGFPTPTPAGLMLVYMHDDTESLEDSFTMKLTDGKHTVQGTLYIYIMPVNDEIPHLSSCAA
ncbi:hypothetical protein Y1Q_0020947 [Alligator mississippiensis]|uniref:Cadherin domain-containing protein n=1 Tax=Alligator mississippiensis TaxID=8496 RepID=A0A151NJH5_ALLMI|nr:hypothetical protein Y1Q_0020947 [Alligator mississippiensis]